MSAKAKITDNFSIQGRISYSSAKKLTDKLKFTK